MSDHEVIIVGGGLTGTALLHDCAQRGIRTLLIESGDLAGPVGAEVSELLDLGGRPQRLRRRRRAADELQILQRTAGAMVRPLPLLWPRLPGERRMAAALRVARARLPLADPQHPEARLRDDELVERVPGLVAADALQTPAWRISTHRLGIARATAAVRLGAEIRRGLDGVALRREGQRVVGVTAYDPATGQALSLSAAVVVNAAGARGGELAALSGVKLPVARVVSTYLRLARRPAAAALDLGGVRLVPGHDGAWLGPLPEIPADQDPGAIVAALASSLRALAGLWPALAGTPVLSLQRVEQARYGAVEAQDPCAARQAQLIDHAGHGAPGLLTVLGGAAVESRWIAELAVDRISALLGRDATCQTQEQPLPGAGRVDLMRWTEQFEIAADVLQGLVERHGSGAHHVLRAIDDLEGADLVCRCQGVTGAELRQVAAEEWVGHLDELLRRTGLGRGCCRGARCLWAAARLWRHLGKRSAGETLAELGEVQRRRFVEQRPLLADVQLSGLAVEQLTRRLSGALEYSPELPAEEGT